MEVGIGFMCLKKVFMFFLGSRCLVWLSVIGCKFVIIVVGWRVCILV